MPRTAVLSPEEREKVPEIVERYLSGEPVPSLAAECGVDRRKLYDWMFTELGGEKYQELVTRCLVARIADADTRLERSTDLLEFQKARESAKFYRMDFERRRPALYGVKQEVSHSGGGPTFQVVLLERPSGGGRVVEAEEKEKV